MMTVEMLISDWTSDVCSSDLTIVGVFLFALIIDWLAPRFGGTSSRVQAVKVAAYSATAGWVAGIFALVPSLAMLSILGLYSLYLLYLGTIGRSSCRERVCQDV